MGVGLPVRRGEFRWLDFDIENRPLSYWYNDRPTAEVTAIGACWVDEPRSMKVWHLGPYTTDAEHREQMLAMLDGFAAMYAVADGVVGHYIRKHDLPILRGSMIEYELRPLGKKVVQDTKLDLPGFGDLPQTQEHLGDMMRLADEKFHMRQSMWRHANRLTAEGVLQTRRRVSDDVKQNIALRSALLARGLLSAPRA